MFLFPDEKKPRKLAESVPTYAVKNLKILIYVHLIRAKLKPSIQLLQLLYIFYIQKGRFGIDTRAN
jgi:hypothetical protein